MKSSIAIGPRGFICLMIIPNVTVVWASCFYYLILMYAFFCVNCINAGYVLYPVFIQFTAYGCLLSCFLHNVSVQYFCDIDKLLDE